MRSLFRVALLLVFGPLHAAPLAIHVAPDGHDGAAGSAAAPLATLTRARDYLRAERAAGRLAEGATVYLHGGLHHLPETFVLEPEDSGTAAGPVVFTAYGEEGPIISGGQRIDGWQVADGRWTARLPELAEGWRFSHLFVNGRRRSRPRLPAEGYYFIAGAVAGEGDRPDRFRYRPGDIDPDWSNLNDVEIHAFHVWSTARLPIRAVDPASHTVRLAGPTWHAGLFPLGPPRPYGGRYLVENVKEALGAGQFYLDRPTATLTYLPLPGESPTEVIAPRLERLVELRGDVAARRWVEHVSFRNLTFAHANWTVPPTGHSASQAEWPIGAAVQLTGARSCALEDCVISQVDGYALELGPGSRADRVERCELADLGAGGLKIGPTRGDDETVAAEHVVRDNLIAHGGRMHPAAVGIWLAYARDCTIEHNDIHDFYYSGISCGWSWGYGATPNRDNRLLANHIWALPQQVLGDMGGIYTLGVSPGSVIAGNLIHDQDGIPWGVGIYLDEGSSGFLVENNVVANASTHAYHINYGRGNTARNNIFAFGRVTTLGRGRDDGQGQDRFERNLVVWREGELLGKWAESAGFDRNLYWPAAGQEFSFGGLSLADWQARGQDQHSLVADPRFVDPDRLDFRLQPGSPAETLGFQPIDVSGAGRLSKVVRVKGPFPMVFPSAPLSPPPVRIAQDFESLAVGIQDDLGSTHEDSDAATARVSAEAAAAGERSLKFTDAPGQKNSWNPHLYYAPHYREGRARDAFDLRLEPGGSLDHAWRDDANPFRTGPQIKIDSQGNLSARGRHLMTIPRGLWVHYELVYGLGAAADGSFDLTVTLPGRPPQAFTDLPCDPAFKALHWVGFVADADAAGILYLDNVVIEPLAP